MATQDHVETGYPRGELEIDGDTVVREQHDHVGLAAVARRVHQLLDLILANTEIEVADEALGMRDDRVWKRLADDGHAHAADLAHRVGLEDAVAEP